MESSELKILICPNEVKIMQKEQEQITLKCSNCGKDFLPHEVRKLEWEGFDIKVKGEPNMSYWLLRPKVIGTYCNTCGQKINSFIKETLKKSVSTICSKSQECNEFRNDGQDLCHRDYQNCIHYKALVKGEEK